MLRINKTLPSTTMLMCMCMCVCVFNPVCFRALKSSQNSLCSLLIVDTPGFQNPRLSKRECSATFEDLCHNYTQERLHTLFYQRTFVQELERYKEVRACGVICTVHTRGVVLIVSFFLLPLSPSPFVCCSNRSTPMVCACSHIRYTIPPTCHKL